MRRVEWIVWCWLAAVCTAGPYTDPGISAYIAPDGTGARPDDPNAVLHPIFRAWAVKWCEYVPADTQWTGPWNHPERALGPATGDPVDIVSLGELSATEIATGVPPGWITLVFGDPNNPLDRSQVIRNGPGYDFAVFENAFVSLSTQPSGSVSGQMFADLAYVDVSSDGVHFARFPPVSLTSGPVGAYGTVQISDVHNLAGKHPNCYGLSTGTPFDLADVAEDPLVAQGLVDLNNIRTVRLVDVPGSGDWRDEARRHIDPASGLPWSPYGTDHPIYDAWPTFGSGGFDLEAIGVLHPQQYSADVNLDGAVNYLDFAALAAAFGSRFGQVPYSSRCDAARDDRSVGLSDLMVLFSQWLARESWSLAPRGSIR